jgi:hypothetical protein
MSRQRLTWPWLLAAALLAPLDVGMAGPLDVKGVDVTAGESEIAFGANWQNGFPANSDFIRQSYETSYSYGFTQYFKAGIKLDFDQPVGEALDVTTAGLEGQIVLIDPSKSAIGLAWYSGLDAGIRKGESDTLTFGPLLSFKLSEMIDLTVNPLFARSWSPTTPGIDFVYAWQVKRKLDDRFSVGVEGYGVIPDIGHGTPVDFQDHRVGPVIYISHDLGSAVSPSRLGLAAGGNSGGGSVPKLELQLGVLFGFT